MVEEYANKAYWEGEFRGVSTGLEALVMRQIAESGLSSNNLQVIGICDMVSFAHVFQFREVIALHVRPSDVTVENR